MIEPQRCWQRCLSQLFLCSLLAGCGRAEGGEEVRGRLRVERSQRGDTTVVRTLRGSVWGDTMVLVAERSIGVMEGEDAYVFGSIRGIDVDSSGRILVVDGQARELRIFSAAGEHLQTIGRSGDGPGEFRRPDHVRVASDGRMVVRDAPTRFSVFSRDGEYLNSWLLGAGFSTNAPFYLVDGDRILNPTMMDRLVWYDLDGTSADTIPVPGRGYEAPQLTVAAGGGVARYSIPFMPAEMWAMARDGAFLYGMNERYALERLEPDGHVLRIERTVEPVPVAAGEAEQARERILTAIRGSDPDWRWEGPGVPEAKPAYRRIIPGSDGTIWVLRSSRGVEEPNPDYDPAQPSEFPTRWREPVVADVFDSGGEYLGPVRFPEELSMLTAPMLSADVVVAVRTHPEGYPQVVRYRLQPVGQS
jgi:hypothetical protein